MSGGDDIDTLGHSPIGYGQPPVAHRFKRGQSGNPHGRPRKAKIVAVPPAVPSALTDTLAADLVLLDEAYRSIELQEGGRPVTLSTVSAVYRAMAVAAVKGNRFAQRTFTERVQQAEERRRQQAIAIIDVASKFKERWSAAFAHADRHGLPRPHVLPHPDDILEGHNGMPVIVGPANEPEARLWSELQARAAEADATIAEHLLNLKKRSMFKHEQFIFDDIVFEHRRRLTLRHVAPDPDTRRTLHYRRPTAGEMDSFSEATKTAYRLFAELTESERKIFLWEVASYNRKRQACHE